MTILKCFDCGNTFEAKSVKDSELVTCPVCEAEYKVLLRDGKAKLEVFIYENEEQNEL